MEQKKYMPQTEVNGRVTFLWNSPKDETLQNFSNIVYEILLEKLERGEIEIINEEIVLTEKGKRCLN